MHFILMGEYLAQQPGVLQLTEGSWEFDLIASTFRRCDWKLERKVKLAFNPPPIVVLQQLAVWIDEHARPILQLDLYAPREGARAQIEHSLTRPSKEQILRLSLKPGLRIARLMIRVG